MRVLYGSCLLLASALALPVSAEPPGVPKAPVLVKVGDRPAVVTVKVPKDGFGMAPAFAPEDVLLFPGETDPSGNKVYLVQPYRAGVYRVVFWAKGETEYATLVIDATGNPGPGPDPVPPPKPKPDPKPDPVTSFRVIFVYESADPLTPAMQRVMFSEKTRNYLDAKTTAHPQAGKGWRRFDKDVDAANERDPDIRKLWQDARPLVTAVPCVIVATNRKADIVPFPADEDAAVALFDKYLGGK